MTSPMHLVVGAGPVGLTMAAELARYGARVRVIDKAAARTDKSKAIVLWPRTLELLDRAGCAARFVAQGFKVHATHLIAGGKHIAHVRLDAVETPYPFALMLPQSDTERLLEEHLNGLGVQVERQVELLGFTLEPESVGVTLRHADGRQETADVSWLLGCDGAHSTVRHGLGMEFEGETLPSRWILADIHLTGLPSAEDELNIYLHADGVLLFFPLSGGRFRLIADAGGQSSGASSSAPTLEEVQAIIDRRGPGGVRASQPVWLGVFTINERKVKNYRAGRVFLAGDAAHVHSPAGGQGMNTGMQDAINLAWKLALVSRGEASAAALLDSYTLERSPVASEVLADAGKLTSIATLRGGFTQALRNQIMSLVFGLSAARKVMTEKLSELSIGYPHSPLTRDLHSHHSGPAAGARVPAVSAGQPIGAGNAPRFVLFAEPSPESAALVARYPGLLDAELRKPFSAGGIWLVRPDGYVAVTAAPGAWRELEAYLAQLAVEA
ncbi:MAG: FAD-dependent monooxygenase [Polyangiaceae bacterium]